MSGCQRMPLPSFCPLFFCPPTAPSIISPACSQSELVFVIPMKWLLLLAAGEGKRALFTIWQSVRPPASRLHDAQNCPACYRTVILPSMTHHPTHRASSCFLWAWLHSSGPGWHAWPVLLSSLLRRPEASLCTSRRSQVCLSSAIIRPLLLPPLPAFWFAARFAGPLFMTKISECNAFELTQSEVQRPDIGCCFTGYDGIFIV